MAPLGPPLVDLSPFLAPERVIFIDHEIDKQACLAELARATASNPSISDPEGFLTAIYERELVSSTGIGDGIAVPHAKLPSIDGFVITIGVAREGVDFQAKDDQPVRLLVMIGASDAARDMYLRVLATVASRLKDPTICKTILGSDDGQTVINAILS